MDTRDLLLGLAVGAVAGLAIGSLRSQPQDHPRIPIEPTAFQAALTMALNQAKGREVALWLEGSGQPIMGKLVEATPGGIIRLDMGQGAQAVIDEKKATAYLVK